MHIQRIKLLKSYVNWIEYKTETSSFNHAVIKI